MTPVEAVLAVLNRYRDTAKASESLAYLIVEAIEGLKSDHRTDRKDEMP